METEEAKPNQTDQHRDPMIVETDKPELDKLIENLESNDEKILVDTVTKIKDMLGVSTRPTVELENSIAKLSKKGVLEILAKIVKTSDNFDLKYNVLWAFINICCGNPFQIKKAIEVGVVDIAVNIIEKAVNNPDDEQTLDLALESVWLLGNIAGDRIENRKACLDQDIAQKIVQLVHKHPQQQKLLELAAWSLKNLVAKKPTPFWNQIADAYKLFQSIIKKEGKTNVEHDSLEGICDISPSYAQEVVESGCIPTLIGYMACGKNSFVGLALKSLGNLVSAAKDEYTDEMLKHSEFLPLLFKLCSSSTENIRMLATWTARNIAAGTSEQIFKIIEHPDYLIKLRENLSDSSQKIRYEASCALINLSSKATIEQVEQLVTKHKYLNSLSEIMKQPEASAHERNIFGVIERIVNLDSGHSVLKEKEIIEQMQQISNSLSYKMKVKANSLINKHMVDIPDVGQSKVPKPQARKKIVKAHNLTPGTAKNPIKRTRTMMTTISEGEEFVKGVNKRYRTRKSTTAHSKEKGGTDKKFRRTSTMKQTLSEAKKILKQLNATKKK